MKKNVFTMLTIIVLVISFTGCGGQAVDDAVADAETMENIEKTDKTESSEAVLPETSVSMKEETVKESVAEGFETEVSYVERDSFYQIKGAYNDGTFFDVSTLEPVSKTYTLEKSVDVYFLDTDLAGYTKDGISVYVISNNDEWSYCSIDKVGLLLKTDELMDAVAKPVLAETTSATPVIGSLKEENAPVGSELVTNEPVMDIPVTEEPVVAESDKYTPEEAVAVWKEIIEEGSGMIYDPSIKEFASWGAGFMYLDKGYPEQAAQMDLEGWAHGDGVGNRDTRYYFEITGSDENCVYITSWGCN